MHWRTLAERAERLDLSPPQLSAEAGACESWPGRHPVVERVLDTPFTPNDLDCSTTRAAC